MSFIKDYLADRKKFHQSIESGKVDEVKSFLTKYPKVKYVLNDEKQSAAATALKHQQLEIYKLLISRQLCLGAEEDIEDYVNLYSLEVKRELREVHKLNANISSIKHIAALISKSKLSHDASKHRRKEFNEVITKAFEELNEIKEIEPMLKALALAEDLNIVFDFYRDSVEHMDPTNGKRVKGICYIGRGDVYIGAKQLLEPNNNRFKALGVLAHELGHYAMMLVYDNNAKPYHEHDDKNKETFDAIMKACEEKKDVEGQVGVVYTYNAEVRIAEMIVRVPHLLALYKSDEVRRKKILNEFSSLFKFFVGTTLVDLSRERKRMEIRNELKMNNEHCKTLVGLRDSEIFLKPEGLKLKLNLSSKVLQVISNCQPLAMRAIYQQLSSDDNFDSSYIFTQLQALKNQKVFDQAANAMKTFNLTLIINCESYDGIEEISQKLFENKILENIIFMSGSSLSLERIFPKIVSVPITFFWDDLTAESQGKLLKIDIKLQNKSLRLDTVLDSISDISALTKLIKKEEIKIGQSLDFNEIKFFIDRKFLSSASKREEETENFDVEHDVDEIIQMCEAEFVVLLSDAPGMGKSTEFKIIAKQLKEKDPTRWIIFMDLKKYYKSYQKDDKISNVFESREEISKFLCEKILKIDHFEAEVFKTLFSANRCVFFLDGVDEICPSYGKFVTKFMMGIQETSMNKLWISTRPHLTDNLSTQLTSIQIQLKPFTKQNRVDFFKKFFQSLHLDGESLRQKLSEIEEFLRSLGDHKFSITNPLMLRIIAEIFDEDPNFKIAEANLYSLYDEFTKNLIYKCMEKGPEAKRNLANQFGNTSVIEFYKKKACETILGYNIEYFWVAPIPEDDEIIRVGLMHSDGLGNFSFVHRTFAEFYVAKIIYETLFLKRPSSDMRSILDGKIYDVLTDAFRKFHSLTNVFNFLDNALDSCVCEDDAEIMKIKTEFYRDVLKGKIPNCFLECSKLGYVNLLIAFTSYADRGRNLWLERDYASGSYSLLFAAQNLSREINEKYWELFQQSLSKDSARKTIFELTQHGKSILHAAAENQSAEVFEFIMNKIESLLLTQEDSDGLDSNKFSFMRFSSPIQHKKEKIAAKENSIADILTKLLMERHDGSNILLNIFDSNSGEQFERKIQTLKSKLNLEDFETLLTSYDKHGRLLFVTADNLEKFHCICDNLKETLTEEKLKQLLINNKQGETEFHRSIQWIYFGWMKDFYHEILGEAKMKEIIETTLYGANILKYIAIYGGRPETIQKFTNYFFELFEVDAEEKLKEMMLEADKNGITATGEAAQWLPIDSIQNFLSCFGKVLNDEEMKEVLLPDRKLFISPIFLSFCNDHTETLTYLKDFYFKYFDSKEMKNLIWRCRFEVENILFHAVKNYTDESVLSLLVFIQELFEDEERKFVLLLRAKNTENETILKIAKDKFLHEAIELLSSYF